MKRAIAWGAALLAAACGGEGSGGAVASSDPFCQEVLPAVEAFMAEAGQRYPVPDDERYGGTAVAAAGVELADGMNAAVVAAYEAAQHQQFVHLMTLLDYDEEFEPRPYLAESWEVAPDTTSITFHIRRDVLWHDGEPTDAHDVAFTYRAVTDPATGFANSTYWESYDRGPDGVEVVDDFTVVIRLRPHAQFLDAWRTVGILPEHLLGEVAPEALRQHPFGTQCPVGNGPFVFASHSPQQQWVFEANPAFPAALGGRPFLDRYVYRVIPEPTTLLAELLTENIDIYEQPSPDQAQRIIDDPNTELYQFMGRDYVFIAWNSRRPQLADARVRRAITMGTNRAEIVEVIQQGHAMVANSTIPPIHWAFDPETAPAVPYDPDGARALLDEAGWRDRDGDGVREKEDGTRLSISIKYHPGNQRRRDMVGAVQAQLAEIGIEVRQQVVEWTTLLQQIMNPDVRDFDGVVMGMSADFKHDDTGLFHSEHVDQPMAWSGTSNPEIDRLLEELSRTTDRAAAMPLFAEYQAELAREQPYTFFYFAERMSGVNKRLRGVVMDARGEWVGIRDWYIDPAAR
jgi:peptide/nickel transport system substrate-binding protein